MTRLLACLAAAATITATASASTPPYRWTPAQAAQQLVAWSPAAWPDDVTGRITVKSAKCKGVGAAIGGRYLQFRCAVTGRQMSLTDPNPAATFWVKVRRQGSGQPCVSASGLSSVPAGCLSTVGVRSRGSVRDAKDAAVTRARAANPEWNGVNAYCVGYGAGFYRCLSGQPGRPFAAVAFSPSKVSVTLL